MDDVDRLAECFDYLAELSDIKGEVRFKVNAYERAAELVRTRGEEIIAKDNLKELKAFPGIGEGIAKKILEFKETGTISKLEELKAEIPIELVTLLQVPNLGPKRAKLIYEELKVRNIDELREAAEAHRLAELRGLGPKAEQNILDGIDHMANFSGRLMLQKAYEMQREICSQMRDALPGLIINPAGSLRRMKETIGDIDLLVASTDASLVMKTFLSLPSTARILVSGDTKSSILTPRGLQVDLRVVRPEEYGAALQYFTGCQAHNIRVREIAKKAGLKVNEYGVFTLKDDRLIAGEDEAGVYAALGMAWPPPEIRENRGEIEAAIENAIPALVELADIKGDLHTHTDWSDGMDSLEEMRAAAEAQGYRYLAITDHAMSLKIAGGLDRERLLEQIRRIRELNARGDSPVVLLSGSELNIDNDGNVDYDQDILAMLDVTIASIHSGLRQPRGQITRRLMKAMRNPHVKIIGHPTGRIIGQRAPYDVDLRAIVEEAATTGTALELNSFPDRLDLNEDNLREASEAGALISLGTDSHRSRQLEFMFYGVSAARRAWLTPSDIINGMDLNELLEWLGRGRHRE
jgi:DNA polymerase (family 10)